MVQILQKFKGARCWLSRLTVCCSALLLSLFSLAGCKDDADGKAHIQLSTWGSAQEVAVLKRLLVDFEKQYPDIRVELMHIPDNYYQKLHILVAGDMAPDVMLTNSINFPVYASQNVFMDLEPLLAQSQTIRLGDFYEPSLQAFKWQSGKQTILGALPRDISDVVVFYNRDLFKKAGLPEPRRGWDWQTFLETARALTTDQDGDGRPEVFGVSFYAQPPLFWLPFVWSAGGALFDARLTRVVLDEPRALEGLRFYADLRNRWHVAPRKVESGGATMSQLFLQQKIAMMVSGRWSVPVLREQAKFQWDVAPLPVGPSGRSRVGIDASGYAISAKTKHPKESFTLVSFLLSRPAVEQITESGLIVPARKDVAESLSFLQPQQSPSRGRVFLDVIPDGVPTRTPPRWNEMAEVLQLALEPVWDGQKDAASAIRRVKPELEKMLETPR